MTKRIDLRSDTVTRPTKGMLNAMCLAKVGDDVFNEDPTVIELENRLAELFGKEKGLFCPSGTMTNQIAIRMHTVPGQEIICHKESHVYKYEGGGIMVNSLCSVKLIDGNLGRLTAQDVLNSINNPEDVHLPVTRLVCLEDTANRGGGAVYDHRHIREIAAVCASENFKLHLDGARVFNALAENKMDAKTYAAPFDSVSICLSKGLGAPVGSVLIGSATDIHAARRIRKVLGGGMRQAGILAAAGIYALENNIERLKDDHRRAKQIGDMMKKCTFVTEILPVETNIVVCKLSDKMPVEKLVKHFAGKNIFVVPFGPQMIRMVTHLDFDDEMLLELNAVIKSLANE